MTQMTQIGNGRPRLLRHAVVHAPWVTSAE